MKEPIQISINQLKPGMYYSDPVFLDSGYILLIPETAVPPTLINHLAEWSYRTVLTAGEQIDTANQQKSKSSTIEELIEEVNTDQSESKITVEQGDYEGLKQAYIQFIEYIDKIFTKFVTRNELNYNDLSENVRKMMTIVQENRYALLRIISEISDSKNYLVYHTVRTTIFSLIIGSQLKFQLHKLLELGVAASLHEIGMIRIPPQIYMADRTLNSNERKAISAHPILGFNMLKDKKVPLAVALVALEHHERMNGSGYPRSLSGEKISQYSRIIAVACAYDAATSKRPYREGKQQHVGIVEFLKNQDKQFDDTVIKALIFSLSLYPVGTFVMLTNGKYGQVIDVNPGDPRYPIVLVLNAKTPDGKELILKTSENGVRIIKAIRQEELPDSIRANL